MLQIAHTDTVLRSAQPGLVPRANTSMHTGVYRWLLFWNVAILALAWGTFQEAWEALFMIVICAAYVGMYFGTPYVMARAAKIDMRERTPLGSFLRSPFEILTGTIRGWEALVQVCLIPASITFAFAGFWVILAFVR